MNIYYIRYDTHTNPMGSYIKKWVIRETKNDMDTVIGLQQEIKELQEEEKEKIGIIYWKKLKQEEE